MAKAQEPQYNKRISLGMTLNMGNYETIRVDVSAESGQLPGESPEDLRQRIFEEVANDLVEVAREYKGSIDAIKSEI